MHIPIARATAARYGQHASHAPRPPRPLPTQRPVRGAALLASALCALVVAAPAPAPEPVMVDKQFTLSSDVLFDFNKATLKPEAGQALDTLYTQIEEARPKDGSATVIGYTDRLGSDAYNQKLSEQRAQTVADYLVGKGLPAGKVNVEGHGESSPVTGESCTSKSTRELIVCLAPDRRVEVKVQGVSEVQQ